ncbi:MAG TPA: hypothetical protein VHG52_14495 [Thermomicrobiales bacterium]|nr:hypothetical protein [Thermomicrobiales bacterium]
MERTITRLLNACNALSPDDRALFDRFYSVSEGAGRLVIPEPMQPWVEETYGSVDTVTDQCIVKVTNRWTLQTALFNPFRSQRPQQDDDSATLTEEIFGDGPDPFDAPERDTSEDTFGRIRGEHCVTASNLAKSDTYHGVIVFDGHNPWTVTEDALVDAFDVASTWFRRCHEQDGTALYPLLIWNCLWKSGASISHAHMQMLVTNGLHYGQIERQRRIVEAYGNQHDGGYFDDLFRVHSSIGLGGEHDGVRVFAHLTPLLANECVLLSADMNEGFARSIHRVIRLLNEELDVTSFNLAVTPLPLGDTDEDWSMMPVVARIVDRGNPLRRTVDTGAMELFAASVVSSDPFRLGRLLYTRFRLGQ